MTRTARPAALLFAMLMVLTLWAPTLIAPGGFGAAPASTAALA